MTRQLRGRVRCWARRSRGRRSAAWDLERACEVEASDAGRELVELEVWQRLDLVLPDKKNGDDTGASTNGADVAQLVHSYCGDRSGSGWRACTAEDEVGRVHHDVRLGLCSSNDELILRANIGHCLPVFAGGRRQSRRHVAGS